MEIKIEGKLAIGFYEWYAKKLNFIGIPEIEMDTIQMAKNRFKELLQSAQFGLIQEYTDTLGYRISIYWREIDDDWFGYIGIESISESFFTSRPEAQVAAIEKLNEIVNQLKQ